MSLVYRGTSSDDVKFNVTERRVYNAPAFDVTGIEVPGRSGDILNSQERFKNKAIVYTGFIRSSDFPGDTTWERLSRGLRTIKAWICGDAGKYHDLTDDYDPGFVRRAFVSGETAISEVLDRPDGATITITFMAEPFMYEESDPIELPETGTASGAIASFEGVAAPLQSLKFSIEPNQSGSGDPSPSNIRPISGWTQMDGGLAGKNLLPFMAVTSGAVNGVTLTANADGTVTLNGTATANTDFRIYASDTVNTGLTGSYILNGSVGGSSSTYRIVARIRNTSASSNRYVAASNGDASVVTGANEVINNVYITVNNGTTLSNKVFYPMLRFASETDANFAPYQGTPITISLGQTVYGGTVDALNGKLVIDSKSLDLGSLSYTYNSTYGIFIGTTPDDSVPINDPKVYNAITSMYRNNTGVALNAMENGDFEFNTSRISSSGKRIALKNTAYTDPALFKTAMSGQTLVYPLATPIEVDLTPVSVNSLLGQNNIWANTGDTEAVYVEPTENPTEWPSKPRLEITMAGAGTLTVNGKTWSIGAYTGTIICDSEIMDWYDASNLKNSLVSGDGFPEFQPGENVITYTGGITKVVAKPRWRTL